MLVSKLLYNVHSCVSRQVRHACLFWFAEGTLGVSYIPIGKACYHLAWIYSGDKDVGIHHPILVQPPTEKLIPHQGIRCSFSCWVPAIPPLLVDVARTMEQKGERLQFQFSHLLFTLSVYYLPRKGGEQWSVVVCIRCLAEGWTKDTHKCYSLPIPLCLPTCHNLFLPIAPLYVRQKIFPLSQAADLALCGSPVHRPSNTQASISIYLKVTLVMDDCRTS